MTSEYVDCAVIIGDGSEVDSIHLPQARLRMTDMYMDSMDSYERHAYTGHGRGRAAPKASKSALSRDLSPSPRQDVDEHARLVIVRIRQKQRV